MKKKETTMTSINRILLTIRIWRSHFDKKWPVIERLPHPLGKLKVKPSGHLWLD